jgi:hypothetical protein
LRGPFEVAAVYPAKFLKALFQGCGFGQTSRVICRKTHQNANTPHLFPLLCARRERPRRCRAANKRDELAPFYLIELHSVRIVGYRIGEDQSGGIWQGTAGRKV